MIEAILLSRAALREAHEAGVNFRKKNGKCVAMDDKNFNMIIKNKKMELVAQLTNAWVRGWKEEHYDKGNS